MTSVALSFNNVQFDVVDRDNQPWLRANQIGLALVYKNPELSVNKLYRANADEFTDNMTALVEVDTAGGKQKVRIFSMRGAHLLAMFARTAVAKLFRKWVLDVLDKEVVVNKTPYQMPLPTMSDKRTRVPVKDAVTLLVAKSRNMNYSEAYGMIHQRFDVDSVEDLTNEQLPQVIEYIHKVVCEFIGKAELPAPKPVLIADFSKKSVFEHKRQSQRHLLSLDVFLDGYGWEGNPLRRLFALLKQAKKDGTTIGVNDIEGAELVFSVTESLARQYKQSLDEISRHASNASDRGCYLPMQGCTTGVACKNLGRKFIGIEKDAGYFEIAKQRLGV
jgi:prophage antirepressor-like protein